VENSPRIRVALITFRRPLLLPRALKSLVAQTFRDWVCEVHNGDPADGYPAQLVAELGDQRITLRPMENKIGPVEAFNLAHAPAPEPYQTILEDDNWWEPAFLSEMIVAMDSHPDAELGWSNMQFWKEEPGNRWSATGRYVWNLPPDSPCRTFRWPHAIQFNDFLYSNGSMLLRSRAAARLVMPAWSPRDMIEHTRERMMDFAIVLVPKPLANFAITLQTFRSQDYSGWGVTQCLLGASFLKAVPMSGEAEREIWDYHRALVPRSTSKLVFAALVAGKVSFLRHAAAADWSAFFKGLVRRPITGFRIVCSRWRHKPTWNLLRALTSARTMEARQRGFTRLEPGTLVDKSAPGQIGL
jgi:hypothetical protein